MERLNFKQIIKKPIFKKGITEQDNEYALTYKIIDDAEQELVKDLFIEKTTNTPYVSRFVESLFPEMSFDDYVLNKEKPEWNFAAYKDAIFVGFLTLQERNYNGTYGSVNFIAIKKEFQGKGYVKDMIKKAENEFFKANITEWRGSTDEKNNPMIKGFVSRGFKHNTDLVGYVYKPNIAYKKFI